MEPIELRCRRAALGLTQTDLADLIEVYPEALGKWESGQAAPKDVVGIRITLAQLGEIHDLLVNQQVELGEHAAGIRDTPAITLRTYASDEDYWGADATARQEEWSAALHRSATGMAAMLLEQDGHQVTISEPTSR